MCGQTDKPCYETKRKTVKQLNKNKRKTRKTDSLVESLVQLIRKL